MEQIILTPLGSVRQLSTTASARACGPASRNSQRGTRRRGTNGSNAGKAVGWRRGEGLVVAGGAYCGGTDEWASDGSSALGVVLPVTYCTGPFETLDVMRNVPE